jgi:hypothetical protein
VRSDVTRYIHARRVSSCVPGLLLASNVLASSNSGRSAEAEPLINKSFCPDKVILAWFSGSFANAHYQRLQGAMTTEPLYP